MNRRQVSERSSSNSAFELSDPAPDHVVTKVTVAINTSSGTDLGITPPSGQECIRTGLESTEAGESFPIDGCTWPGSSSS